MMAGNHSIDGGDDQAIFRRLETSCVIEQVNLMRHLEDKRQKISDLRLKISAYSEKKMQIERELRDAEVETASNSAHVARVKAHMERLNKGVPHTEEDIKNLEKKLAEEKQQTERQSLEMEEILSDSRTLLQRFYVQYESMPLAIEIRELKMKIVDGKQQLTGGEEALAERKRQIVELTANTRDASWKPITDKVIQIAKLKCETNRIVSRIRDIEAGLKDEEEAADVSYVAPDQFTCDISNDVQVEDEIIETTEMVSSERHDDTMDVVQTNVEQSPYQKQQVYDCQPREYVGARAAIYETNQLGSKIGVNHQSSDAAPRTPSRMKPPVLLLPPRWPRISINKPPAKFTSNEEIVQNVNKHGRSSMDNSTAKVAAFKVPAQIPAYLCVAKAATTTTRNPAGIQFPPVPQTPPRSLPIPRPSVPFAPPRLPLRTALHQRQQQGDHQQEGDANRFGYFFESSNTANFREMPFAAMDVTSPAEDNFHPANTDRQSVFSFFNSPPQSNNHNNNPSNSPDFTFAFNNSPCPTPNNNGGYSQLF